MAGYLRSLILASGFNATILGVGIALHDALTPAGTNIDAAVAVLLVAPGLVSAYLARPGEHVLVGRLVRPLRYALVLSTLAVYVAAGAVILYLQRQPDLQQQVWWGSFLTALVIAATLSVTYLTSAWRTYQRRRQEGTVTKAMGVIVVPAPDFAAAAETPASRSP
jgi:multisubunit Na+/H+ antiporter MnhC subunit